MSVKSAVNMSPESDAKEAAAAKPRVRDRIFETARQLFYRHGLRAVGVEAIACEAGTNKVSFYRSFTSKDELIAEYLRDQCQEYWALWDAAIAPYEGNPRRQLEALFDDHITRTCADNSRGCALGNAAIELPESGHPGREVVEQHKIEMRRRLRALAGGTGVQDADTLGDTLMLLMEGGYLTRLSFDTDGPIRVAGKAVRKLIDCYLSCEQGGKTDAKAAPKPARKKGTV